MGVGGNTAGNDDTTHTLPIDRSNYNNNHGDGSNYTILCRNKP
jgi:hypothetical protein